MSISKENLVLIAPASASVAESFVEPLNTAMDEFEISVNKKRQAAFLAQILYESTSLTHLEENLNYNEDGLKNHFGSHFSQEEFAVFARQKEKIANRVYANRMGNGPETSGDGYRYRGRGLIQLTGKDNYKKCGDALELDLVKNPELLKEPVSACRSAAWFWKKHGLNELADIDHFTEITIKINGGENGLVERKNFWAKAKEVLKSS
ncbi:MAG: glycoside hydrolase family 19 protein [Nitrospirae bacterium]|nr:glycoside hydrolase family 19 protein [Nitrospirota bacterium]MBF0533598.1 glycoside hydrolase family 19 protein [Nitrospirota bacterium]MBF0617985.1 glycoside hydrolase family 19 protein [Nitrospirota bacterium]